MNQMLHVERDYRPLVWTTQKLTARLTGSFYLRLLVLANIFLVQFFLRKLFISQLPMARNLLTA
uniref:Fructose-bisphosphate aldolase n=1 Tax=Arundo donax TaxID=35708 RepID=A0A0A8ZPF1_ARUDO